MCTACLLTSFSLELHVSLLFSSVHLALNMTMSSQSLHLALAFPTTVSISLASMSSKPHWFIKTVLFSFLPWIWVKASASLTHTSLWCIFSLWSSRQRFPSSSLSFLISFLLGNSTILNDEKKHNFVETISEDMSNNWSNSPYTALFWTTTTLLNAMGIVGLWPVSVVYSLRPLDQMLTSSISFLDLSQNLCHCTTFQSKRGLSTMWQGSEDTRLG